MRNYKSDYETCATSPVPTEDESLLRRVVTNHRYNNICLSDGVNELSLAVNRLLGESITDGDSQADKAYGSGIVCELAEENHVQELLVYRVNELVKRLNEIV